VLEKAKQGGLGCGKTAFLRPVRVLRSRAGDAFSLTNERENAPMGKRHRGPTCNTRTKRRNDPGTLCKQLSPIPGPHSDAEEHWYDGAVRRMKSAGSYVADKGAAAGQYVSGHSKSLLLTIIDLFPFKQDSPISTAILKHYVEKSGEPFEIEPVPKDWQDWIVKKFSNKPGFHKDVSGYGVGLYDLQHSLGHFDLNVT